MLQWPGVKATLAKELPLGMVKMSNGGGEDWAVTKAELKDPPGQHLVMRVPQLCTLVERLNGPRLHHLNTAPVAARPDAQLQPRDSAGSSWYPMGNF